MIQHIKFGQNSSFGSRDAVQTSFFWSTFDVQSAGVTLKMWSRSPKSNHFYPMSLCTFGQNPQIGSGDKSADKAHFYSLYSVVTLTEN